MTLPRWVRAADALALSVVALSAFVFLFGGFAGSLGSLRLSIGSPGRLLLVAAALIAIRHALYRDQPLHLRLASGAAAVRASSDTPIALGALGSRVAVVVVAYYAVATIGLSLPQVGFTLSEDPFLNLQARFDAGWYATIAQDGYSFHRTDQQSPIAFFPALPMTMRAAGVLFGGYARGVPKVWRGARLLWAGAVVSMLAFVWASIYLVRVARLLGLEARAPAAVMLMAAYPFAAYFSAAYTEGLFLLGSIAAFYHFARREWGRAFLWGLLIGLTRPNGCLLSVALAVMIAEGAWRHHRAGGRVVEYPVMPALAAASASGIGLLVYCAYIRHLTGSWFAWAQIQQAWGRSFVGLSPIADGVRWISEDGLLWVTAHDPFATLNAAGFLFAIALVWPVWRRLGPPWAVFVLLNVLVPFVSGGVLSIGRMSSTLFPLFLALAAILPARAVTPVVLAFALGQGLVTALFFTWRPMF